MATEEQHIDVLCDLCVTYLDEIKTLKQEKDNWKKCAEQNQQERNEMQLVAGRYQFQFEHAMKCINKIDDVFEYAYENMTQDQLRVILRTALADFTDAVKKVNKKGG